MIHLEKAEDSDLQKIASMAEQIWMSYYTIFLPVKQIRYMLDSFYSLPALSDQILKDQNFFFIKDEIEDIGFISISKKSASDFFIHKFYLYTELREKKIGSSVMELIVSKFKEEANNTAINIRLTVNRQNFKAINFYFKNGFRIESVEDFDIGNGYFMNDFVMIKIA